MTTADADTARWSLPGPADMPTDQLQVQLEVYQETVLLRGFEGDTNWVRTVSADEIAKRVHSAPGLRLGATAGQTPSGGARGRLARWWHCGGRPRSGRWRCKGRPSSLPPGSGFPCRGWSSSAHRPGRPGSTPPWNGPTDPDQQLYRAPAFNVFRDGRTCPGSHRFPEEVGRIPESFFQSFFSLTGDTRDRSKKHPDNLQALWEELGWKG